MRKSAKAMAMVEDFAMVSEYKGDIAAAVLAIQDASTRKLIEGLTDLLVSYATGSIVDKPTVAEVPADVLRANLSWLAIEIATGLAMVDIQLGNFKFLAGSCVLCGGEVPKQRRAA